MFRFLYEGQRLGSGLIVGGDDLGRGGVAKRLVQAIVVPPMHPVQRGSLNLGT